MEFGVFTLSHCALLLSAAIILMSVVDVFSTGRTRRVRVLKILTAGFAITLLIVQAVSNKRDADASQKRLHAALEAQKRQITDELTGAFTAGTSQIVIAAGQEADKTRKAANDQTKSIQSQANEEEQKLADAALGSDICPMILATSSGNQRPHDLYVFNSNKGANIYDLVVYVQEGEHGEDGKSFRTIQQGTLKYPTIPPGSSSSLPFEFLSQKGTSYLQFSLSTRRKICSGQIVLHGDGHGWWYAEAYPIHEGPLAGHNTEIPLEDKPWNSSMIH